MAVSHGERRVVAYERPLLSAFLRRCVADLRRSGGNARSSRVMPGCTGVVQSHAALQQCIYGQTLDSRQKNATNLFFAEKVRRV